LGEEAQKGDLKMERLIEEKLKAVNELLPKNYQFKVEGRYGYWAIDIYDEERKRIVKTLISGLKTRELYDMLDAFQIALSDLKLKRVI